MENHNQQKTFVFGKSSCRSSRLAMKYLEKHRVPVEKKKMDAMTEEELRFIMRHHDSCLEDLLMKTITIEEIEEMKINDFIEMVLEKPSKFLKGPIIVSVKEDVVTQEKQVKILIGYNEDEISVFLDRKTKVMSFQKNLDIAHQEDFASLQQVDDELLPL